MGVTAGRFKIEEAGIAVFAEAFPLEKIREILKATGREEKRKRQLPAVMMVYYVVALGLFVSVGCREVLRRLLDGAMWIWPEQIRVSTESAITQARQRLGAAPIEQCTASKSNRSRRRSRGGPGLGAGAWSRSTVRRWM